LQREGDWQDSQAKELSEGGEVEDAKKGKNYIIKGLGTSSIEKPTIARKPGKDVEKNSQPPWLVPRKFSWKRWNIEVAVGVQGRKEGRYRRIERSLGVILDGCLPWSCTPKERWKRYGDKEQSRGSRS